MDMKWYRADWVVPVSGPPLPNSHVGLSGSSLVCVGSDPPAGTPVEDLGATALVPGWVMGHTHLELTGLGSLFEDRPQTEWFIARTLLRYRFLSPEDYTVLARLGAWAALTSGITAVADCGETEAGWQAMIENELSGIHFQEFTGPHPTGAEDHLTLAVRSVASRKASTPDRIRLGLAPQSVYTASTALLQRSVPVARREGLDLAIHVGESLEEQELTRKGTGPYALFLKSRMAPLAPRGVSPVGLLAATGFLDARPLLVHGLHMDEGDLTLLQEREARLAICPEFSHWMGADPAPADALRDRGVEVALGVESGPGPLMADPVKSLREGSLGSTRPGLSAITLDGARVLGLHDGLGSLEAGKRADLVALDLAGTGLEGGQGDPEAVEERLVATVGREAIRWTMTGGQIRYCARRDSAVLDRLREEAGPVLDRARQALARDTQTMDC